MSAPATKPVVAVRTTRALGTVATVIVADADDVRADEALKLLMDDLATVDATYSRFRPDSELRQIERHSPGEPTPASPLLFDALEAACAVAARTAGVVDPTIGCALVELGYDRDFASLQAGGDPAGGDPAGGDPAGGDPAGGDPAGGDPAGGDPAGADTAAAAAGHVPAPGWWTIRLDAAARTVTIPAGIHVDLGATGKAFAADRSAARISRALDAGILVNLGGDVAVVGPPPEGGWGVGIASSCRSEPAVADAVVALRTGGLATSGTTSRTWIRGGRRVHHIVDPWTGDTAPSTWALASVVDDTCLAANGWSTAAVVWGADAPGCLASFGVTARLVGVDGTVVHVGEWPADGPDAPFTGAGAEGGGGR